MSESNCDKKISEMIKSADLYDLIKISLKSSDTKLTAVDRYIQRALERQQQHQNYIIDDVESLQETNTVADLSQIRTSDMGSFVPTSRKSISQCNSKRKSEKVERYSIDKTPEPKHDSRQSSPQKRSVTVYSQKVGSGMSAASQRHTQQYEPGFGEYRKECESVVNCSIRESTQQLEKESTTQENILQVQRCQYASNEDHVPSPKKTLPKPQEYVEKAPCLNESVGSDPMVQQRESRAPSVQQYQSNECGRKDTTPTRREASYARQTMSSQYKQRSALPEEFQPSFQSREQKYQSRANLHDTYTSNKSLSRSVSNSVLYREGAFKSTKKQDTGEKGGRDVSCNLTQDNDLSHQHTIHTIDYQEPTKHIQQKRKSIAKYEELVQQQVNKVAKQYSKKNNTSKKQKMLNSFAQLNLSLFVELGRIKKPQKYAYQAGRMLCQLVNAFREKPSVCEFTNWDSIQNFVTHNVNKFSQEVNGIKQKVLEQSNIHQIHSFLSINEEYFNEGNMNTLKNSGANKQLKVIVCFVYNVVQFILSKELQGETTLDAGHDQESQCEHGVPSSNVTNDETPRSSKKHFELDRSPLATEVLKQTITSNGSTAGIQTMKKNVSPKPNFGTVIQNRPSVQKMIVAASPYRQPVKSKFTTIENFLNEQNALISQKSTSKKTPNKSRRALVDKSNTRIIDSVTPTDMNQSSKKLKPVSSMANLASSRRDQGVTSPKQKITLEQSAARKNSKSPMVRQEYSCKKIASVLQSQRQSVVGRQSILKQQDQKSSNQEVNDRYAKQEMSPEFHHEKEETVQESEFNFSPGKLKDAIHQHRSDICKLIMDKSCFIESNMTLNVSPSKKIDMSIIEDLKKRRLASRQRQLGANLDEQRDAIISDMQKSALGE